MKLSNINSNDPIGLKTLQYFLKQTNLTNGFTMKLNIIKLALHWKLVAVLEAFLLIFYKQAIK